MTEFACSAITPFSAVVTSDGAEAVVAVTGELDLASAGHLEHDVRELYIAGVKSVAIDLRHVEFMDSTGLRVLLTLRNTARREGHPLILVPGPPQVQRIFELTATRALFDWHD